MKKNELHEMILTLNSRLGDIHCNLLEFGQQKDLLIMEAKRNFDALHKQINELKDTKADREPEPVPESAIHSQSLVDALHKLEEENSELKNILQVFKTNEKRSL